MSQRVQQFTLFGGSSEDITAGNSSAVEFGASNYSGVPVTVQIYGGGSPVGTLQGVLAVDESDTGDASALWADIVDGSINADGLISIYAPVTHIRVAISSGTCKARILH